jgi:hypothetical protein
MSRFGAWKVLSVALTGRLRTPNTYLGTKIRSKITITITIRIRIRNQDDTPRQEPEHKKMRLIILALGVLVLAASGCRHLPDLGEEEPPWVRGPEAAEHSSRFITAIGTGETAPTR